MIKILYVSTCFAIITIFFLVENVFAESSFDNKPIACQMIIGENSVPSKFVAPINFFSPRQELILSATCFGRKSVEVEVGSGLQTQYIYKYGYNKVNGKTEKITFTGSKTVGSWIVGSAKKSLAGVKNKESGEIIAYICYKKGEEWKCGCEDKECKEGGKWTYQKYELDEDVYQDMISYYSKPKDFSSFRKNPFEISHPSKSFVSSQGGSIILYGAGFSTSTNNMVMWNGVIKETSLKSKDGSSLEIPIPKLDPGKYQVRVKKGEKITNDVGIWIKDEKTLSPPKITNITPQVGVQGDVFTITGEGFTSNNDILTTFGVLSGQASPDGKKIQFTYSPFEKKLESFSPSGEKVNYRQPIAITIYNVSGVSNTVTFYLSI